SGEPTVFVKDFETGFVVAPDPRAIAEKLNYCIAHPQQAATMGANGWKAVAHISWEAIVSRLLTSIESAPQSTSARGIGLQRPQTTRKGTKILVTDNQVLDPPVGGGRLRIYHLYKHLAQHAPVTYVGAYDWPGAQYREQTLAPNFTETVIPLTQV